MNPATQVGGTVRPDVNVQEVWSLYDSIVICPTMYGSETNVPGWFTSFALFGQRETHSFYKGRTEANAGDQYNNQKNSDTMDFAFLIHSVGFEITGPPVMDGGDSVPDGAGIGYVDPVLPQWFQVDFPRHCAIKFIVQQDVRIDLPCLACPPGYGTVGGGTSFETAAIGAFGDIPFMSNAVAQGTPLLRNRYPLPEPIAVPRTATIEAVLTVGQAARLILQDILGPISIPINSASGVQPYTFLIPRYVLRVSMFGQRLVQQRGQYFR